MRILIVEDNKDIAENIGQYFEQQGHTFDFADNGIIGLHLASVNAYDVVVLDLMLPGIDGLEVCRRLREDAQINTPILMLTARDSLSDKLNGFAAGGDDYLVKPFALTELDARIKALYKRSKNIDAHTTIKVADLEFNPETLSVHRNGQVIQLRPITRKILSLLMRNSHRVVTRTEIEFEIWGDNPPDGDSLRAHIYTIRNAIDKPFPVKLLHTLHATGFRLAHPDEINS